MYSTSSQSRTGEIKCAGHPSSWNHRSHIAAKCMLRNTSWRNTEYECSCVIQPENMIQSYNCLVCHLKHLHTSGPEVSVGGLHDDWTLGTYGCWDCWRPHYIFHPFTNIFIWKHILNSDVHIFSYTGYDVILCYQFFSKSMSPRSTVLWAFSCIPSEKSGCAECRRSCWVNL